MPLCKALVILLSIAHPWPRLLFPCAQEFQQRHGLRACMLAPTKIIAGLGMSLGITVLQASREGALQVCLRASAEWAARCMGCW